MPTSADFDSTPPQTDSDSRRSTARCCPECGARLSSGTCPACALGLLLGGVPEPEVETEAPTAEEAVAFGRYLLKERLAAGGMGVVYIAEDRKLKRCVALKMIRGSTFADDGEVARFTLEAEAAAALDHPNIVPIYEVGRLDGQPFFTMKLIEGQTLAQRLRDHGGTLPAKEVASLLAQIARAVHHAHQRGVLHRDLKPGNILIDADGQPWLTDFGLAKVTNSDTSLTLTKDHIGTPHYMAPEVAGGNARSVSTASDVWALGVMLWEMLCGVPPFHGPGPVEIMRRIVESEPNWPAGSRADGDLVTIARRCMEKQPGRRPQSAAEVADELERWLRGEPIKARPVTRRERFVKWMRREPAMAALYAVLLVAMLTGLVLWNRAEHAVVSLRETNVRMEDTLRLTVASRMAADARLQVDENPSRALLLAVESVEMMESRGGVLPESASALMEVLGKVGGLDATAAGLKDTYAEAWLSTGRLEREAVQTSTDNRWLLTVDYGPLAAGPLTAAVFDLHDKNRTGPLRRWTFNDLEIDKRGFSWGWMPDSRTVVFVERSGRVQLAEVVSPQMVSGLEDGETPLLRRLQDMDAREGWEPVQRELRHERSAERVWSVTLWWKPYAPRSAGRYAEQSADGREEHLWNYALSRTLITADKLEPGAFIPAGERCSDGLFHAVSRAGDRVLCFDSEKPGPATIIDFDHPEAVPAVFPGMENPYSALLSPHTDRAVIRDRDNQHWLYELPEKNTSSPVFRRRFLEGLRGDFYDMLAFSPDGRWLALAGLADTVVIEPLVPGKQRIVVPMKGRQLSVVFSENSRWLAVGGTSRAVHLWLMDDIEEYREPIVLRGSPTFINAVSFTADDRHVLAGGGGATARRWTLNNVSGSALPQYLPAGLGDVRDIAVSPDQEWIAAACLDTARSKAGEDNGLITVSRAAGRAYRIIGQHHGPAGSVAFSKNGRWLVSAGYDQTVRVWDFPALKAEVDSGSRGYAEPRFVLPVNVRPSNRPAVAFHPGDGCLYQVNGDGKLFAWDLSLPDPVLMRQEKKVHSRNYMLPHVAVSPDGRLLAIARHAWDNGDPLPGSVQEGNQVLLYDVSAYSWEPKFLGVLKAGFVEETDIAFSPDGRWLAAGANGTGVSVWDLRAPDIAASRLISPFSAQATTAVGFSPDSRLLAFGGNDGRLYLWDWQNPTHTRILQTGKAILTLEWLEDGRLAVAGSGNRVAVWDTSIPRLKALARRTAGRELTPLERVRFQLLH